jgi:hypothetical protein
MSLSQVTKMINERIVKEAGTVLEELGLEVVPGGIATIADIHLADKADVHPNAEPVAVTGYALAARSIAVGRFPKLSLFDIVDRRSSMDASEALALARVCGASVPIPFWDMPNIFAEHLFALLDRYELHPFFKIDESTRRGRSLHLAFRPTAVDWTTEEVEPFAMHSWRTNYSALPAAHQMLVASIMWLYRGGEDKTWLVNVPCAWLAADAIPALKNAGLLEDWGRLVALYPGW